jgi:hypothetical protein
MPSHHLWLQFSPRLATNGCSERALQQGFLNPKSRQFAQGRKPPHATGSKISNPGVGSILSSIQVAYKAVEENLAIFSPALLHLCSPADNTMQFKGITAYPQLSGKTMVVERTHSRMNYFRPIPIRCEKVENHLTMLRLAGAGIILKAI